VSTTFQARAHPAGGRIDIRWTYDRPLGAATGPPPLRVMRKRLAPPVRPGDGLVVADVQELVETPSQAWRRLERIQCHTVNSTSPEGMLEAEVTLFYKAPLPSQPLLVRLRFFDAATQATVEESLTECSRVVRASVSVAPWQQHETLKIFRTPGGGPEVAGGQLDLFTGNLAPTIPDRLVWTPVVGPARVVEFDKLRREKVDRTEATDLTFETRTLDADPGNPWLTAAVRRNEDAGIETWSFWLRDSGLEPKVDYYYALFDLTLVEPLLAEAVALATQDYGSPRRLFRRLPGAYQRLDEPDPTQPSGAEGSLRQFLVPIGQTLDAARSTAEGLRDRHDVFTARSDLLPPMARMIGWSPDLAASVDTQRRDLLFAPEIFDTVGTGPNVHALINRVTSWPCRVKEYVHNVFLTNAPEEIRLWELWTIVNNGTTWGTPAPLTLTTDVDARPAAAVDGAGVVWLFWHSDRGGRRDLWRQRLGGVDAAPVLARAGAPDDVPGFDSREEDPAAVWDGSRVWLFWSSSRDGKWDLWARTFAGPPPGSAPIRITEDPADDRSPAAVVVPGAPAHLWVFWSSARRGPTDIWARVLNLSTGVWADPGRLTDAPLRDERPTAAVDGAGRIWLFWTRDSGGRQVLWHRVRNGTWGAPQPLDMGHRRDEAPTVVPWKGGLLLLWQSDHEGPWQVWGRFHDGAGWHAPRRLDPDVQGNKDPAAVIDAAGHLRVTWRSQRRAMWYRSRTVDFNDPDVLSEMGTVEDHGHYSYDTGLEDHDWYARDAVGIYLQPTTVVADEIETGRSRASRFIDPFRPLPARYLWLLDPGPQPSHLSGAGVIAERWADDVV
jgi:hypothetical protein